MPFTAQEVENIANQALAFYMKNKIWSQTLEDRPTMNMMRSKQKSFPGGKDEIKGNVKGTYTTEFMGFEGDDTVEYGNPANVKQFTVPWKNIHAGIKITLDELKRDGISVVDSMNSASTTTHSQAELTRISSIFEDKLEDMDEGSSRSFNTTLWRDGTQSSKVFAGIQSIIVDDPTQGIGEGLDRATNSWWRNRAFIEGTPVSTLGGAQLSGGKVSAHVTNQTLTKFLRAQVRQLRRYGGKPNLIAAGSDFIEALEAEIHEKGTYTQEGFLKSGATDIAMADITMRGVGKVVYEPELDNLGMSDRAYFIDTRHLFLMVMDGEDMKTHTPARPAEKYVMYRSITWTGCLVANKMNAHMVVQAVKP